MPTSFHWLILCTTSAKQMPLTKCEINKHIFQNGQQNIPTTYQERCGTYDLMTAWLTFQKHANNVK